MESGTRHEHVVGFYERADELIAAVAPFLASALDDEGTALVIATPSHRVALEAALVASGHVIADLEGVGQYLALDAREILGAFMRDDRIDRAALMAVMSKLLDGVEGNRPLHAFGEMVALLWDAGNVDAAIELESLWNELGHDRVFSLYCAYSMASLEASGDLAAAKHMCDQHSNVIRLNAPAAYAAELASRLDGDEFDRVFVPAPAVIREVRSFVREVLRFWGEERLVAEAQVIVAELATNAVVHASSPFRVSVSRTRAEIRLAVRDASAVPPQHVQGHANGRGGRGISIVAALANAWDTDHEADGKTIWATMTRSG